MATTTTNDQTLAINGGTPCVVEKPASYQLGPGIIGDEEIQAVTDVLKSKNLFRFHKPFEDSATGQFEILFKQKLGVKHVLAVNAGTSALITAMIALGVEPGDEVIVPGYTYIATAAAALTLGAFPVIAEIDDSLNLDPVDAEKKITPRTKLIVAVHMRGVPCKMDQIMDIGRRHNVKVLEDAAQANGGSYKGKPLGSWGDAGAFSFQHFKIMTAGEGGAFVTNDDIAFERGACYHDSAYAFWMEKQQQFQIDPFLGENFRMSEINGALALEQLKKRDELLARCRMLRDRLRSQTDNLPGITFQNVPDWEGDCGIGLGFFADTPERSKAIGNALSKEGMSIHSVYSKSIPNRHIYPYWDYILEKRTPHANGWPWKNNAKPCEVQYTKTMCPRTLELLDRAFIAPITQFMSEAHIDSCAKAMHKVTSQL